MTRRLLSYLTMLWTALLLSQGLHAQETEAAAQAALDPAVKMEILTRLNQYIDDMQKLYAACRAKLPLPAEVQISESYLRTLDFRYRNLEQNLKSLDVRWNSYYPSEQWEISQDEALMDCATRMELMKQEASDSLEVRKQMLQSLHDFDHARAYLSSLDSTYNSLGKRAFELSLTSKTTPLLEKQKQKEQLLFATVQEKFDKAREVEKYHLVSDERMEELEDLYAVLKNKSDTIQNMAYKPLLQRIKDYLMGLAAVAVLLMFISMMKARLKAAKEARENLKKYKDALHLSGQDEYPTI